MRPQVNNCCNDSLQNGELRSETKREQHDEKEDRPQWSDR